MMASGLSYSKSYSKLIKIDKPTKSRRLNPCITSTDFLSDQVMRACAHLVNHLYKE